MLSLSLSLSVSHACVCVHVRERKKGGGGVTQKKKVWEGREKKMSWMQSSVFVLCFGVVQFLSVTLQFFLGHHRPISAGVTATMNPAGRKLPHTHTHTHTHTRLKKLLSCSKAAFSHLVATCAHTLTCVHSWMYAATGRTTQVTGLQLGPIDILESNITMLKVLFFFPSNLFC